MKLTTKGKFAVTAMVDIAINSRDTPITLQMISERQGISVSYLEQLFVKLRRKGMVKSYKGPGGGYTLGTEGLQIRISEIVKAVDENLDARSCGGNKNCRGGNKQCLTHDLWSNLTEHVYSYLQTITLADLMPSNKPKVNTINYEHRSNI